MSLVKINWKPDNTEIRKFGVAMIIGFTLIALFLLYRQHSQAALYCFLFGVVSCALSYTSRVAAMPIYVAWMGIAFVMGNIISRILLTVFYYGMITPIGFFMRLIGRDKLMLKKRETDTYWQDFEHVTDKSRYERQF